jgi:hypothetical protein
MHCVHSWLVLVPGAVGFSVSRLLLVCRLMSAKVQHAGIRLYCSDRYHPICSDGMPGGLAVSASYS